jgi:hypothetical protein
MANILNATYTHNGFKPNATQYDIVVTLDGEITIADINSYLPNNGSRYQTISGVSCIPSKSMATILSTGTMFVCVFIAEIGSINSTTKYQEGIWKCLGKKIYLS